MKLNIIARPEDVRVGYLNISENTIPLEGRPVGGENAEMALCNLSEINEICLPGEADEVLIPSLEKFPDTNIRQLLDHWVSRAAIGGTVTVSSIDIREVAFHLCAGNLETEEAVTALYHSGQVFRPYTLNQLSEALRVRGVDIYIRRHEHLRAWVSGIRK